MRLGRWRWTILVFGGALALSACSSPQTPGVLTQADIPSYLGVRADPSATGSGLAVFSAPCKGAKSLTFDGSWRHLKAGPSSIPDVTSIAVSCASVSQAQRYFNTRSGGRGYPLPGVKGHSVAGIGDEAWLTDVSNTQIRDYTVGWRQDDRVMFVMVEGPSTDKRITPALAKLLARRAAARS